MSAASSSWRSLTRMPRRTAQLGVLGEVGVVEAGLPDVHLDRPLLLGDLAELRCCSSSTWVIGMLVLHGGGELGEVLAEAAVAGDRDDRPVGRGGPRAHGGREAEADRAEVARHQHRLAACTRSSGRTSRCCCRRRRRSPRRRAPARLSASNTAAELTPRPRSSASRRAFSARQIAHRAATSGRWSTRSASRASASVRRRAGAAVTPTSPSTGHGDRVEAAERHRVEVDLDDRLVGGDAGVVRERRPEHDAAGRTRS